MDVQQPPSKRVRTNDQDMALTEYHEAPENNTIRTSSLAQPTMKLMGHTGSVYALQYDPSGENLCSGSFDMTCLLWSASGHCDNYNVLRGHKNAILDLQWSLDGQFIATASADKNLGWYHANTGDRIKRFMGHEGIVNAVDTAKSTSPNLVVSASDDGTARLWDARTKGAVGRMDHDFQVTAIAYADETHTVYTGGIDNLIVAWDVRQYQKTMAMSGHTDTITSLSLHPTGTHLLSNSMDGTLQTWDVRPFTASNNKRHDKTFLGGTHGAEKGLLKCAWNADGTMVTGGSADRLVHIWDELSAEELYCLPGHTGPVNTVVFHPKEHMIASGSSDKSIYVGELSL